MAASRVSASILFVSLKLLSCVITRSAFVTSPAQEAQETQEVAQTMSKILRARIISQVLKK